MHAKCDHTLKPVIYAKYVPYLPVYNAHFFPKFIVRNLHCALYAEPFVC